jgi:hypothetical protein
MRLRKSEQIRRNCYTTQLPDAVNAKRVSELAFEHPLRLYSSILNQEGSLLSKSPKGKCLVTIATTAAAATSAAAATTVAAAAASAAAAATTVAAATTTATATTAAAFTRTSLVDDNLAAVKV